MINPLEALKIQQHNFHVINGSLDSDYLSAFKNMLMHYIAIIKIFAQSRIVIVLTGTKLLKHEGMQVASLIIFLHWRAGD